MHVSSKDDGTRRCSSKNRIFLQSCAIAKIYHHQSKKRKRKGQRHSSMEGTQAIHHCQISDQGRKQGSTKGTCRIRTKDNGGHPHWLWETRQKQRSCSIPDGNTNVGMDSIKNALRGTKAMVTGSTGCKILNKGHSIWVGLTITSEDNWVVGNALVGKLSMFSGRVRRNLLPVHSLSAIVTSRLGIQGGHTNIQSCQATTRGG